MGVYKTHGLPNALKQRAKGNSVLLQKVLAYKLLTSVSAISMREVYFTDCPVCHTAKTLSITNTQILLSGGEKIIKCSFCRNHFKTYYRCT